MSSYENLIFSSLALVVVAWSVAAAVVLRVAQTELRLITWAMLTTVVPAVGLSVCALAFQTAHVWVWVVVNAIAVLLVLAAAARIHSRGWPDAPHQETGGRTT